jgi:uncharacterized protein YkwD
MRLLLCAVLVLAGGSVGRPAPRTEDFRDLERAVVRLINAHRTGRGLGALATDTGLARIARAHSLDMAERRVPLGHDGFSARAKETERYLEFGEIAENVALNDYDRAHTVRVAVDGWLTSPHHVENIEGRFNLTGVGIARSSSGTYYYTQIFVARRPSGRRP